MRKAREAFAEQLIVIRQKSHPSVSIYFDSLNSIVQEMFQQERVTEQWLDACLKHQLFFVFKGVQCFGEYIR